MSLAWATGSVALLAEEWAPQGLYPVDSLFKLFALWAISDLYGWIFAVIFPLTICLTTFVRAYSAQRRGQGIGAGIEYLMWSLVILFFLWPVEPTIAAPLLGAPEEDVKALEETKKNLLENQAHRWSGVPRILMWGMAIHDTLFNQVITKVRSLNARPIGEREYLRIRLAHAVPLDEDLARTSAIYWIVCYEKAMSNMLAAQQAAGGGGTSVTAVMPLDASLDQHFPPYDQEEWEAMADSIPEGDLIEDAGSCQGLRQQLVSDYGDEISEDEHESLLEDLRDPNKGNVSFSDDEYKGYLVRQSVTANATFAHGLRAVLDWDGTDHDVNLVPVNDDDFVLYRWGAGAVNWVYDWWTSASAAYGVHVGLPAAAKQTAEVSRMLAPSLYGVAMMLVIVIFPFVCIAVMAGSCRALFVYYRLYLATAMTPLIWELLTSFELFFAQRDYEGLASFMGDGATYAAVAIPFLFAAAPALSAFIVFSAFAVGGGGGGGSSPTGNAAQQAGGAGREMLKRQERAMGDAAVGAATGAVKGAVSGGKHGASMGAGLGAQIGGAGGPELAAVGAVTGASAGAIGGAGIGAVGGAAKGGIEGLIGNGSGRGSKGSSGVPGLGKITGSSAEAPAAQDGDGWRHEHRLHGGPDGGMGHRYVHAHGPPQ